MAASEPTKELERDAADPISTVRKDHSRGKHPTQNPLCHYPSYPRLCQWACDGRLGPLSGSRSPGPAARARDPPGRHRKRELCCDDRAMVALRWPGPGPRPSLGSSWRRGPRVAQGDATVVPSGRLGLTRAGRARARLIAHSDSVRDRLTVQGSLESIFPARSTRGPVTALVGRVTLSTVRSDSKQRVRLCTTSAPC